MEPLAKLCPLFSHRDYMKKPFDVVTDDGRRFHVATNGKYIFGLEVKDGDEPGTILDVPDHAMATMKRVLAERPTLATQVDRDAFAIYCGEANFPGPCPHCAGGQNKPTCSDCHGSGETECSECGHERDCESCDGLGDSCLQCGDLGIFDAAESSLHKNWGIISGEGFNTMFMARILACAPDGPLLIQVKPDHGGIYLWGAEWVAALMPLLHENSDVKPFKLKAEEAA